MTEPDHSIDGAARGAVPAGSPVRPIRDLGMAIYLPSLLFGIGQGAIVPVMALSALQLGASTPVAAFAVASVGLGKIAGDVPAGVLANRVGERRAMLVATVLVAGALVACACAPSTTVLCAGLLGVGVASAVWGLARQAYLTEVMPFEFRGRALAMLGGMQRVGMFVGPLLAAASMGVLGTSGAYWVHLVVAVVAAALLVVLPEPDAAERRPPARVRHEPLVRIVRQNLRVFATLGVGSLMVSAARAARQVLVPLWAVEIGLEPATASLVYGLSGAAEMAVFYLGGVAMDRLGRLPVAVCTMLGLGLSLAALPATSGAATIALVAAFMGVANGLGSGINMTIGSDVSPTVGRSTFLGAWRLWSDVGNGAGPVVVSLLTAVATLGVAAVCMGGVAALAALVLGRWVPRRATG